MSQGTGRIVRGFFWMVSFRMNELAPSRTWISVVCKISMLCCMANKTGLFMFFSVCDCSICRFVGGVSGISMALLGGIVGGFLENLCEMFGRFLGKVWEAFS